MTIICLRQMGEPRITRIAQIIAACGRGLATNYTNCTNYLPRITRIARIIAACGREVGHEWHESHE